MKGDLGSLIWVIIVVIGIVGKLLDKKGPQQGPVARSGRPGQPTLRPGQEQAGRPGQSPAGRPGQVPAGRAQSPARSTQTDGEGQSLEWAGQSSGRLVRPSVPGRPSLEVPRPGMGQKSATQKGRLVNNVDDDGEGVSMENVEPTVHVWQDSSAPQPEAAPTPILQQIPVQQAVVWAEILGKPVSMRGRR